MTKKRATIPLIFLLITLAACTPDANEQYIQGTWLIANNPEGDGSSATKEFFIWQFNNGTFLRHQEVNRGNEIVSQGRYRVLESQGDVIVLELYDIQGERFTYENSPVEVSIQITRDQDTIQIYRMEFERAGP